MPEIDATEAAAALAAEQNIDLSAVAGSGAGGRITKPDVEAHLAAQAAEAQPTSEAAADQGPAPENTPAASPEAAPEAEPGSPDESRQFTADELLRSDAPEPDQIGPVDVAAPAAPAGHDEGPGWSDHASVPEYLGEPHALASIAACTSLAQLLVLDVDRVLYAEALRARAKALLQGQA